MDHKNSFEKHRVPNCLIKHMMKFFDAVSLFEMAKSSKIFNAYVRGIKLERVNNIIAIWCKPNSYVTYMPITDGNDDNHNWDEEIKKNYCTDIAIAELVNIFDQHLLLANYLKNNRENFTFEYYESNLDDFPDKLDQALVAFKHLTTVIMLNCWQASFTDLNKVNALLKINHINRLFKHSDIKLSSKDITVNPFILINKVFSDIYHKYTDIFDRYAKYFSYNNLAYISSTYPNKQFSLQLDLSALYQPKAIKLQLKHCFLTKNEDKAFDFFTTICSEVATFPEWILSQCFEQNIGANNNNYVEQMLLGNYDSDILADNDFFLPIEMIKKFYYSNIKLVGELDNNLTQHYVLDLTKYIIELSKSFEQHYEIYHINRIKHLKENLRLQRNLANKSSQSSEQLKLRNKQLELENKQLKQQISHLEQRLLNSAYKSKVVSGEKKRKLYSLTNQAHNPSTSFVAPKPLPVVSEHRANNNKAKNNKKRKK